MDVFLSPIIFDAALSPFATILCVGGTSENFVFSVLFNLTPILCNIKFSAPMSHSVTGGQDSLLPPMRFTNVAVSLCPSALNLQSLLLWCHAPCVQQYFEKIVRGFLFLALLDAREGAPPPFFEL